jgi:hypothetical protein
LETFPTLISSQYAYSILNIISGIFVLPITVFITTLINIISLSHLHFDKVPTSTFWISQVVNPALWSYRAAIIVDHDNTNPIKMVALQLFNNRLEKYRNDKIEVRKCAHCFISYCVFCKAAAASWYFYSFQESELIDPIFCGRAFLKHFLGVRSMCHAKVGRQRMP